MLRTHFVSIGMDPSTVASIRRSSPRAGGFDVESPVDAGRLAAELSRAGYVVVEGWFPPSVAAAISLEAEGVEHKGRFKPATIKYNTMETTMRRNRPKCVETASTANVDRTARGDVVWWCDGADRRQPLVSAVVHQLRELGGALGAHLAATAATAPPSAVGDVLREHVSKAAKWQGSLVPTSIIEDPATSLPLAMMSVYESEARFEKHRDAVSDEDLRVLTAVYYFNRDWNSEDGGQLQLWPPDGGGAIRIEPEHNTLVVFFSRLVTHEVLPARAREAPRG